jgi:DNA-binding winged helix-turn-helix (wHTH) protein/tetratricopeptide (TPR) repeat protein
VAERSHSPKRTGFGVFELDLRAGELRKGGVRVKLQDQPLQVLAMLLERPGEVVTREELQHRLWPADTFVDFEHGINVAVRRLREALEDSAETPRFVETLPRHGYRFIAPVEQPTRSARMRQVWIAAIGAAALVVLVAAAAFFYFRPAQGLTESDYILLTDFVNATGESVFDGTLKQALAVKLEESPFLNIVPERRVRETLRFMNRSVDEPVTASIGREVCQRQGVKAIMISEIAVLGSHYVITLDAEDCHTGDSLAREQVEARSKEEVLGELGQAISRLRGKLGEALNSIEKHDVPIEQATTSSLEALKAFSQGNALWYTGQAGESIPFYKRAIELDPNFALAYAHLGHELNIGESELVRQYQEKAFELRERVSEREKLNITAHHYDSVTGDIEKARETCELWRQIYPRDSIARINLANLYNRTGQYEKAIEEAKEALRLDPDNVFPYSELGLAYRGLNRFDEAKAVYERLLTKYPDAPYGHFGLYIIAFIQGDSAAMQRQREWAKDKPAGVPILAMEAQGAAFSGQLRKARGLFRRARDLALGYDLRAWVPGAVAREAVNEALFGNFQRAREQAVMALDLARTRVTLLNAAFALARSSDVSRTEAPIQELEQQFRTDTLLRTVYLPSLRAILLVRRDNPARAIELLQTAARYERAYLGVNLVRGQAYLAQGNGVMAAAEFQRILDQRGVNPLSLVHPLAGLGLARAYAQEGDTDKSRQAYARLFEIWKDADPDIPILQEAKAEYAKLQESEAGVPTN